MPNRTSHEGNFQAELRLWNKAEEVPRVHPWLEELARAHGLPKRVLLAAELALEEWLTDIVAYAHPDQQPHPIIVRAAVGADELRLEVEDDGIPFNPLTRPAPDTSVPLAGKPIGGLGIHMLRRSMDRIEYRREGSRNVLTLVKSRREEPLNGRPAA